MKDANCSCIWQRWGRLTCSSYNWIFYKDPRQIHSVIYFQNKTHMRKTAAVQPEILLNSATVCFIVMNFWYAIREMCYFISQKLHFMYLFSWKWNDLSAIFTFNQNKMHNTRCLLNSFSAVLLGYVTIICHAQIQFRCQKNDWCIRPQRATATIIDYVIINLQHHQRDWAANLNITGLWSGPSHHRCFIELGLIGITQ